MRKKHTDGKWYKRYFIRQTRQDELGEIRGVSNFIYEIEWYRSFGMVMPDLVLRGGGKIYELDEDQRSDEEIMKEILEIAKP